MKLMSKKIYLKALERDDCHKLYRDTEYDPKTETVIPIGYSVEKADEWFEEINRLQHKSLVRLGVYLFSDEVIGDVALQDIDWQNRSATLGLGISTLSNRSKGYGYEALSLIIDYGFNQLNLYRLSAETSEKNHPAQRLLIKSGFRLEGTLMKAEYADGKWYDKKLYSMLKEEYKKM